MTRAEVAEPALSDSRQEERAHPGDGPPPSGPRAPPAGTAAEARGAEGGVSREGGRVTRMPPMQAGEVIAGKYRLEALVDRGGMGAVWRAQHLDLGAPVAVKLMDASIARRPEALARFHREARAAAQLRSPHVVQI